MTALTIYGSNVAASTIGTAGGLAITTGGTASSCSSKIGTSTGYGELWALSNSNSWAAAGSVGTPDGNGWIYDTSLSGNTLTGGTFTPTLRVRVSGGSATVDFYVELYKYNSSGNTYTSIGSVVSTGNSLTTAFSVLTPSNTISPMAFGANDYFYYEVWANVTANSTGSGAATLIMTVSNSATQGITTSQIVSQGYTASVSISKATNIVTTVTGTVHASVPVSKTTNIVTTAAAAVSLKTVLSKTTNIVTSVTGTMHTTLGGSANIRLTCSATLSVTTTGTANIRLTCSATISTKWHASAIFPIRTQFLGGLPAHISATAGIALGISGRIDLGGTGVNVIVGGALQFILVGTLQITNSIGKRSTAAFKVLTDTSVHFQQYQTVEIFNNGVLIYTGYLSDPKESKPGFQDYLVHDITCVDQHYLADKRIIAVAYANRTPGDVARQIVNTYLAAEGVTIGSIANSALYPSSTLYPGPTVYPNGTLELIPSIVFAYCSAAQAFDSLAARANINGTPFYWQIDKNKQFWFVPYTAVQNSIIVDGTQIDNRNNIPVVDRQNPTYRNKQYIIGGVAQTSTQTEIRVGDGNTTSWAMGYDMFSAPTVSTNIGSAGYLTQTVGVKGIDTGKEFYWAKGSPTITQDSSGTKLTSSDKIQVVYIGQYPSVVVSDDPGLIAQQQVIEGTSGIVESVLNDTTIGSAFRSFYLCLKLGSTVRAARHSTQLLHDARWF